jgi:hypothetical protein
VPLGELQENLHLHEGVSLIMPGVTGLRGGRSHLPTIIDFGLSSVGRPHPQRTEIPRR